MSFVKTNLTEKNQKYLRILVLNKALLKDTKRALLFGSFGVAAQTVHE